MFFIFLRYVIVAIIILYLVNKVGKFFTRLFFTEEQQKRKQGSKQQFNRRDDRSQAEDDPKVNKKFTAGEYVDYEEVE